MELSISSILGQLTNVKFHEKDMVNLKLTPNIVGYRSNFAIAGEIKVKKKKNVERSSYMQGDGTCFNSQITFLLKHESIPKPVHFKLFRNGKIICTGYNYTTLDVFFRLTNILIEYLTNYFNEIGLNLSHDTSHESSIRLISHHYILQNYKVKYDNEINLSEFVKRLEKENSNVTKISIKHIASKFTLESNVTDLFNESSFKQDFVLKSDIPAMISRLEQFQTHLKKVVFPSDAKKTGFISDCCTRMLQSYIKQHNLLFISYNPHRFSGLILKVKNNVFDKSLELNPITIKIFKSGKINIDGKQNRVIADFYNNWITEKLDKYNAA
jgi:TATA-box binding protein (TBP) (component of TFIID and TFIIIB)